MVVRSRVWGACALVLAVAACSGGTADEATTVPGGPAATSPASTGTRPATSGVPPTTGADPTTTVAAVPTTALPVDTGELGVLDAALTPTGTVDVDQALALVAAGYRPIPGVVPAATPLIDGGPALRTLLASGDTFRDDQRTALGAIVAQPGVDLATAAASTSPRLAAAAAVVTSALATFAGSSAGSLAAGERVTMLELPYDNGDGTHSFSSPGSHATAVLVRDGADSECRIRVNATSELDPTLGPADPAFVATLGREAFHCLQYGRVPDISAVPVWVVEGGAAYAGDQVAGLNALSSSWWNRWVGQPQRPLDRRSYDALGYFSMIGETADAYSFALAFLGDPSADSVRRREPGGLFDRWGEHYATRPDWGPPFVFPAPGAAGLTAPATGVALTVDGPAVTVGGSATTDLSAMPYLFAAPGDVLVVVASPGARGGMRFADGQTVTLAQATQSICVNPAGCACPGIAPDALAISEVPGPEVFIGVGPSSGAPTTLAARSLARWCQEVLVPPPAGDAIDPCLVADWTTRSYSAPSAPGVAQTVTGGDGATVSFAADRTVRVDTAAMTPVVITTTDPTGTVTTTTLQYRGAGTGTWRAADGVVDIAGLDTTAFGIHVRVDSAGATTSDLDLPVTDLRLAGFANLLGTARYECTPVSLTLTHVVPGVGGVAGFELAP